MHGIAILIALSLFMQISMAAESNGGFFGFLYGYPKFCFCRCGITEPQTNFLYNRFLGGETIKPHSFPWLALIHAGSQIFQGTLISERHVITTASLLHGKSFNGITISLGAYDRCGVGIDTALNVTVESIIFHPGHSPVNLNNDLAILRTRHLIPFSQYIAPICLPNNDLEADQVAWIASWSNASTSCNPRVVAMPTLRSESCFKSSSFADGGRMIMTNDKGCLGPLGVKSVVCESDIGAPVMHRWSSTSPYRLIGVVSSASCETDLTPLYTKVIEHTAWIRETTRNDCQCF